MIFPIWCKISALCLSALVIAGSWFGGPKYKNCVVMKVERSIFYNDLKLDCTITKYDKDGKVAKIKGEKDELVEDLWHFSCTHPSPSVDPDSIGAWRDFAVKMAGDLELVYLDDWAHPYSDPFYHSYYPGYDGYHDYVWHEPMSNTAVDLQTIDVSSPSQSTEIPSIPDIADQPVDSCSQPSYTPDPDPVECFHFGGW